MWAAVATDHASTTDAVKKYWKSLRDKYVREKKEEEASMRSGAGTAEAFKSTWQHMSLFSFLKQTLARRS